MDFKNTQVFNVCNAIVGMRNPLQSWDKSDTKDDIIGKRDLELAQRLVRAGTDHSKFMRQILINVDITAPMYWWKEFDTYKVGTVANSESTMHTLMKEPIMLFDFNIDFTDDEFKYEFANYINTLEYLRKEYLKTKDINIFRLIIQMLPQSYNQLRTVTMNYQVVRNIYFSRHRHKLTEWSVDFMNWIDKLPYADELIKIE